MLTHLHTSRVRRVAAAAAVVPLAVLAVACGDESDDPSGTDRPTASSSPSGTTEPAVAATTDAPTDSPSDPATDPATEIPDDFPLAARLPERNGDGTPVLVTDESGFGDTALCGRAPWTAEDPSVTDVAGVTYAGEAEDFRGRTLALYADEDAARAALERYRSAFAQCPDEEVGGTVQAYEEVDGDADGATLIHRYGTEQGFDTGLEVLEVRVVGRALYLSSYYGEANGSAETRQSFIDQSAADSAPVIEAMAQLDRG